MNRFLTAIAEYKWGTWSTVIATFLVFICAILLFQWKTQGRVDPLAMVNRSDPTLKSFLDGNPRWEYVDHHSRTSLYTIRERESGKTSMIDLAVLSSAETKARPCDAAALPQDDAQYPAAAGTACFEIVKPQDSGDPFVAAISFTAQAKSRQVADFYRNLFATRGCTVTAIQDSSSATILEAEDSKRNTVARISIRSSFDTSYAFLAWTRDFR
jgi:hypothetical protein